MSTIIRSNDNKKAKKTALTDNAYSSQLNGKKIKFNVPRNIERETSHAVWCNIEEGRELKFALLKNFAKKNQKKNHFAAQIDAHLAQCLSELHFKQSKLKTEKKKKKTRKSNKNSFVSQAGILAEMTDRFKELNIPEQYVSMTESVLILFYQVSRSTNMMDLTVAVGAALKTIFVDKSISMKLYKYFKDIFNYGKYHTVDDWMKQQSGVQEDVGPLSVDDLEEMFGIRYEQQVGFDLLPKFKFLVKGYKLVRSSEFLKRVKLFVSKVLSFVCCKWAGVEGTPEMFKQFYLSYDKKVDAFTLMDICISTCEFLDKSFARFFLTGRLSDLFGTVDMTQYEDDFVYLCTKFEIIKTRPLEEQNALGININIYAHKLEQTIIANKYLRQLNKNDSFMTATLGRQHLKLELLNTEFINYGRSGTNKIKPIGVYLYGDSGVGKSVVMSRIVHHILKMNNYPSSNDAMASINDVDKFDSSARPSHSAFIYDDAGQTMPKFVQGNPTMQFYDLLNNETKPAIKAAVEEKGKVFLCPKVVGISTNVPDLHANVYNWEPAALMRRFEFYITVRVKEEYQVRGGTALDTSRAYTPIEMMNLQEFSVKKCTGSSEDNRKTLIWEDYFRDTEDGFVDFATLLNFLTEKSQAHFVAQRALIDMKIAERNGMEYCECDLPIMACVACRDPMPFAQQSSFIDKYSFCKALAVTFCSNVNFSNMDFLFTLFSVMILLPNIIYLCYVIVLLMCNVMSFADCSFTTLFSIYVVVVFIVIYWNGNAIKRMMVTVASGIITCILNEQVQDDHYQIYVTYLKYRNWIPNKKWLTALTVVVTTCGVIKLYSMFNHGKQAVENVQKEIVPQGGAISKECGITKPFPEEKVRINEWIRVKKEPIPVCVEAKTATRSQLISLLTKKLCYMTIHKEGRPTQFCNILPVCNSYWLMPKHVAIAADRVEVRCTANGILGRSFKSSMGPTKYLHIPGTDLALVNFIQGGDNKDITKFFPEGRGTFDVASLLWQPRSFETMEYVLRSPEYRWCTSGFGDEQASFDGFVADMDQPTFGGLCMAIAVPLNGAPTIAGIHLAGNGKKSMCGILLRKDLLKAVIELKSRGPHASSSGSFPSEIYGRWIAPTKDVHPRNPAHFLGLECSGRIYGEHEMGGRSFHSDVVKTIISPHVQDIMNIECLHGKPQGMNNSRHIHRELSNMMTIENVVDLDILDRAANDLYDTVKSTLTQDVTNIIQVLPLHETLNGIPSVFGIDAMNFSTSAGFPLNKAKSSFVTEVQPDDPTQQPYKVLDSMIVERVEEMKQCFRDGERCYAIHRANRKDEATKLTKDKVRIFAGADMAFLVLVRQYMLTMFKVIMEHSYEYECAVGINATGPQWTWFINHVTKHGRHRTIAGDYGAFDKKMSTEFMSRAMEVFVKMGRAGGYTDDDICILRGIITEIIHPLYEIDGNYVQISGSNPSGQPATVFVNNFVNSLYLRYAYYKVYEGQDVPRFNTRVAAMCYGDDNVMTVAEGNDDFNHTSISRILADIDVKYTMPDKTSESVPFCDFDSISFLKRQAIMCEELGLYLAPIEEASIAKTLHCVKKSKHMTPEGHATECINNALREYFHHGREVYTVRQEQLRQVAAAVGIEKYITVPMTFDERIEDYRYRYLKSE